MNLREEILQEHSKENSLRIAGWIGHHASRMKQLTELFLHDEYRVVQRAAWIMSIVAEKQPQLLTPHLHAMVNRMGDEGIPVAVKRNVVRVLQHLEIPEDLQGPVMDYCFRFLEDQQETVAVKAFSMTILARLAKLYPDIKQEIVLLIEDLLREGATPGIVSRGKRTLKELEKIK